MGRRSMGRNLSFSNGTAQALGMVCCLSAIAGCSSGGPDTGFTIIVKNPSASSTPPKYLQLDWLGTKGFLFKDRRIPGAGDIQPEGSILARVGIDTDPYEKETP